MKKLFFAGALCMMLCVCASGMAGTMFNVCLSKECLTEQEIKPFKPSRRGLRSRANPSFRGMMRVNDGLFLSNWKTCRRRQSPLTTHG